MIVLMFTVYAKYFFGTALLALFWELFQTLRQARRERKEEANFKELSTPKKICQPVLVEEKKISLSRSEPNS